MNAKLEGIGVRLTTSGAPDNYLVSEKRLEALVECLNFCKDFKARSDRGEIRSIRSRTYCESVLNQYKLS